MRIGLNAVLGIALLAACRRTAPVAPPLADQPAVRPAPDEAPATAFLRVRVVDASTGRVVPAKLWLTRAGIPVRLARHFDPPDCEGSGRSLFEIAPGALGTWNGIALWRGEARLPIGASFVHAASRCNPKEERVGLPAGRYHLVASRGPEYELAEVDVDLRGARGDAAVELKLVRSVDTRGYLAADLHIHTADGSRDSSVSADDRVKTEIAAGVEVLVSSDHDHHTSLSLSLARLFPLEGKNEPAAAVVGNEVSSGAGHFNLMPVTFRPGEPGNGALDANALPRRPENFLPVLRAQPGAPLVQVNHPRLGYEAYFDSWACGQPAGQPGGWRDLSRPPGCSLEFDSVEVMSGAVACGSFIRRQIEDYYALLRLGRMFAGVGASDTHHDSGILAGFPRTYVRVPAPGDEVEHFSEAAFIAALRGRAAIATTGPFLTMTVAGGGREGDVVSAKNRFLVVAGQVSFPSWMTVNVMRLLVDGRPVKTFAIDSETARNKTSPGRTFSFSGERLRFSADAFVNLEAQGNTPLPEWLVGDHLKTARRDDGKGPLCPNEDGTLGMIPFAMSNPVFVDVDGDGMWRGR